uniref:Cyclin dependent kinase 2 interacting protein n=1 Tax=Cyanistes caeruleus TaxID=156563 RepID=A0A8C0ZF85_CYACU
MENSHPPDSTPRRPVLSVSARKIKDNAADWHNLMMKWERLNDNGFTTANKIVNMRISEFQDNKLEITCDNNATEPEKPTPKYNEELDKCCAELLETLKHMVIYYSSLMFLRYSLMFHVHHFQTKIQLKMEKLTSTTKAICDLETFHHGAGNCMAPFFHTWPTPHFYEVSLKLSEMYKKELQLKQTIVQDIAHSADQDLMMVYLSSWLYQPYIENSSMLLLEAMLLETGHRQFHDIFDCDPFLHSLVGQCCAWPLLALTWSCGVQELPVPPPHSRSQSAPEPAQPSRLLRQAARLQSAAEKLHLPHLVLVCSQAGDTLSSFPQFGRRYLNFHHQF